MPVSAFHWIHHLIIIIIKLLLQMLSFSISISYYFNFFIFFIFIIIIINMSITFKWNHPSCVKRMVSFFLTLIPRKHIRNFEARNVLLYSLLHWHHYWRTDLYKCLHVWCLWNHLSDCYRVCYIVLLTFVKVYTHTLFNSRKSCRVPNSYPYFITAIKHGYRRFISKFKTCAVE